VLVGGGIEQERLAQMARDQELTNVEFIGHQPKEKVGAFFSAAEVLFAHLKAAPHRVGTVPEKILAYMACGRPVLLAVQEGAAADIIRSYDCASAPDDPRNWPSDLPLAPPAPPNGPQGAAGGETHCRPQGPPGDDRQPDRPGPQLS
jgi:glycosyltransferase involved in cell wall biosynthesis